MRCEDHGDFRVFDYGTKIKAPPTVEYANISDFPIINISSAEIASSAITTDKLAPNVITEIVNKVSDNLSAGRGDVDS